MFKWVPPGVYDYLSHNTRYLIGENGKPIRVITKLWLDKGGPEDVDESLRLPWGAYPDFPPKPPKK